MKLRPLQGIDDLCFGDGLVKAISIFGEADEMRSHPDSRCRTSLFFRRQNLTLGFDTDDRLMFIAVLESDEELELWDDRPFDRARCSSDRFEGVRQWIKASGRIVHPHQDSFGASLEVRDEGVTFCFSSEDSQRLDGIQLSLP
jgi:hypothetical protein